MMNDKTIDLLRHQRCLIRHDIKSIKLDFSLKKIKYEEYERRLLLCQKTLNIINKKLVKLKGPPAI